VYKVLLGRYLLRLYDQNDEALLFLHIPSIKAIPWRTSVVQVISDTCVEILQVLMDNRTNIDPDLIWVCSHPLVYRQARLHTLVLSVAQAKL
jgi:hypothetical protein